MEAVHTTKAKDQNPRASAGGSAPNLGLAAPSAAHALAGLPLFLRNANTTGLSASTQPLIGPPHDAHEQQADAVAQQLTASSPTQATRTSAQKRAQRKNAQPKQAAANATAQRATRRGGQPLSRHTRAFFEAQLGADLSGVRIHTDDTATAAARALQAKAFTSGQEIVFGAGQFAPETDDGRKLLAHELTHVAQQTTSGGSALPAIQRAPEDAASSSAEINFSDYPSAASNGPTGMPSSGAALSSQLEEMNNTSSARSNPSSAANASAATQDTNAASGNSNNAAASNTAAGGGGEAAAATGGATGGATANGEAATTGAAGGSATATQAEAGGATAALAAAESGAGALGTGDLVLIDLELAEHQRWAGALGHVGAAASVQRAEFIAEAVGSGFIQGAASGAAMGLGIGLVTRAVPALGPILGGGLALHGLVTRDWAATGATIGRFGEGNSTYEMLANTLDSISAIIDIVSQVLTVINGIVGVVQIAALAIAGGAVVAAFFTFGATAGIAVAAGEVAATCEEISLGINAVTSVLDEVNSAILQPCVTLFRALHTFTTQADPREVEAQGQSISTAASASGAALGAWAGGHAAQIGGGAHPPAADDLPPTQRPPHETPPPAAGDGPSVHFQETPASSAHADAAPVSSAEAAPASASHAEAAPARPPAEVDVAPAPAEPVAPAGRRVTDDQSAGTRAPAEATPPPAPASAAAEAAPQQLTLPGMEGAPAAGPRRPLTPDEVAPANTRSAYLRRLRAEAEGRIGPDGRNPDGPGRRPNNIARHEIPDRANVAGSWESSSPTPDLYQHSPRQPAGHESHHVEQQAAFRAPAGSNEAEVIAGYNPREDPTVMMRRNPDHEATFAAQTQQRAEPDFHETVGTPAKLEEARNIAVWGTRDVPPPGSPARQRPMMDERVAGQAVMEHAAYLFETSRISDRNGPTPGVPPRPGETPLANRPVAGDLVAPRGGVEPFENIDWNRTFNQPDPHRAAQPPGTQLALPGMEHLAPRPAAPAPEQLTLPSMDRPGPNPNQLSLPFDTPATAPRPVGEGSTRSQRPLTDAEFAHYVAMAEIMGMPRDQIQRWSRETAYGPVTDNLFIGPDIHPLPAGERPTGLANPANAALEPRAVLGHEIIGHREAELMGQVRDEPWHEELQASARAALHTPDLTPEQRWLLIQDSAARRRHQQGDGEIYINTERYGVREEPGPAASRPPEQFRPQDQLPSVIVDWDALGATPPRSATGDPVSTGSASASSAGAASLAGPRVSPSAATTTTTTGPLGTAPNLTPAAQAARNATAGANEQQHPEAASPTFGTRARQVGALFVPQLFGPDGPAPTYAEQQAAHRARFTADNQPAEGVERVNPNYPAPPATPARITALQNEIANLLAVRARAEQEAQQQDERAQQCVANRDPIQQTVADTTAGISATQAHQEAIARREAVNQEQQQRQQEAQGLVAGYPSRATGLTALTVPLAAWAGFTSLASHLPGDAGDSMLRMNQEARQLQAAFVQMGAQMLGVDSAGPARQAELQNDQTRLGTTGEQAQASGADLQTARAGATGLQEANEATRDEAVETRDAATGRAQECSEAITQREEQADSLAAQMRDWASAHQAARQQAIAATEQRLQQEGRTVVRSAER